MTDLLETLVVTDIFEPHLYRGVHFPMWTLYDHPSDLPDHFVLRLWDGATARATPFVYLSSTIEEIEKMIENDGRFVKLSRYEADDHKIIAAYI